MSFSGGRAALVEAFVATRVQTNSGQAPASITQRVEDDVCGHGLFLAASSPLLDEDERELGRRVARLISDMDAVFAALGAVAGEAGGAA
ncbi:MAG: hypothetical protein WD894_13385 [Pirellulales bacterium]